MERENIRKLSYNLLTFSQIGWELFSRNDWDRCNKFCAILNSLKVQYQVDTTDPYYYKVVEI